MFGLADYDMHTPLCHHAEGHRCEYVDVAAERGLAEMGFACHSPMMAEFDDWRMRLDDLPRYLEMVEEARVYGASKGVVVRLGLEVDYLPGHDPWIGELMRMAPWDYLIGSVHYLTTDLIVDHPDHVKHLLERYEAEEVWECYWDLYERAIRTQLFDFMAHPDLPKKFGQVPDGDLTKYYAGSIMAMRETDTAFEINTAGLRKPIGALYPAQDFLNLACRAGVPLVISSDAHSPTEVGEDFDQAIIAARCAGYRQLAHFEKRHRTLSDF